MDHRKTRVAKNVINQALLQSIPPITKANVAPANQIGLRSERNHIQLPIIIHLPPIQESPLTISIPVEILKKLANLPVIQIGIKISETKNKNILMPRKMTLIIALLELTMARVLIKSWIRKRKKRWRRNENKN
jgi:hypothetical protein